ncbi:MAG: trigger factor [Candidatus Spechtbacterales bacterium]
MDIKIEQKHNSYKEALFSITPQEMDKYLNEASEKLAKGMNVKGFREGKIPRKVVEKRVGAEAIWREAAGYAMEYNYWQAVKNEGIEPTGMPKIEVLKIVPGNNFEFKALIPVMPKIELPDYKAIAPKVKEKEYKKDIAVDDKEVEQSLQWLQQSRAESPREGEKEPKLPEINDEFARGLGNFNNLDSLKESLKEGLVKEKENQERQRVRLRMLEEITKSVKLEVPDFLVEQEMDRMRQELEQQVNSMDMTLEDYLKKAGKSSEEVKEGWKDKARQRVESGTILKAIADKENIKPSEEEVEKEANKYLAQFKDTDEVKSKIDPVQLRTHINGIMRNEKVFELLENSPIKS